VTTHDMMTHGIQTKTGTGTETGQENNTWHDKNGVSTDYRDRGKDRDRTVYDMAGHDVPTETETEKV
jgi:hypothetical protein